MYVKIKFYNPQKGSLSKVSYTYESQIDVNVDDIVVVDSAFGLIFGIVTELMDNANISATRKILCVVPTEESYI